MTVQNNRFVKKLSLTLLGFFALILASCYTVPPQAMTHDLARRLEPEIIGDSMERSRNRGLRFFISADIALESVETTFTIPRGERRAVESTTGRRLVLMGNTRGRLRLHEPLDVLNVLNVAFEGRGRSDLFFPFVPMRNENPMLDGLFVLEMNPDPRTGRNTVEYGGERYFVIYEGDLPPFLLVQIRGEARTRTRRIWGLW